MLDPLTVSSPILVRSFLCHLEKCSQSEKKYLEIKRDSAGMIFNTTTAKPSSTKTEHIVELAEKCLQFLEKGKGHEALINRIEQNLQNYGKCVISSTENRWWYSILHFFGYKAKIPEKMQQVIAQAKNLKDSVPLKAAQKKTHVDDLKTKAEEKQAFDTLLSRCPLKFRAGFSKAPRSFIRKVFFNPTFSTEQKEKLFLAARDTYHDGDATLMSPTAQLTVPPSFNYLKHLQSKYPFFHTSFPGESQWVDNSILTSFQRVKRANIFPATLPTEPYLYGQLVKVNGNHRTALVIDFQNKTVEFFNSFGSDSSVKTNLKKVAEELTAQYGVTFQYIHKTTGITIQHDGYQCGIWACYLLEKRVMEGKSFNFQNCADDKEIKEKRKNALLIAKKREQVLQTGFKAAFYEQIYAKEISDLFLSFLKNAKNRAQAASLFDKERNKWICQNSAEYKQLLRQFSKTGKMPDRIKEIYSSLHRDLAVKHSQLF